MIQHYCAENSEYFQLPKDTTDPNDSNVMHGVQTSYVWSILHKKQHKNNFSVLILELSGIGIQTSNTIDIEMSAVISVSGGADNGSENI